jgi:outer membrane lipopolysaccharide assembly protein LptE/RlpB
MRVALAGLAALVGACGYQWAAAHDPGAPRPRVAVETLTNDTYEPGVESLVTDALRREFVRRGGVELVRDPELADLVLGGSVRQLVSRADATSSVAFAIEYELTMRLALSVTRAGEEAVELDPTSLQKSEFYFASSDVEVQRKNRQEALRRVASAIAGRVHDTLFESPSP